MMSPLLDDALQIIEIAAIHDYKPSCLTKEQGTLFISKVRQCMGELGTGVIEGIAFRLLAWLDDNERLYNWDKRKFDATEWSKLCDELFVEFNKRMEKQEKDNA